MHSIIAKIVFSSNRHCFAGLPKSFTCKCSRNMINAVKIESSTSRLVTSWSGEVTFEKEDYLGNIVEISGLFASKLGFKNGQEVTVTLMSSVGDCSSAQVEPASVDDWEILEVNASNVEASLLNQVRVITMGQVFPIWVQKSACVFVKVGALEPFFDICLLQPNTELIISPKMRSTTAVNSTLHTSSLSTTETSAGSQKNPVASNGMISSHKNGLHPSFANCNMKTTEHNSGYHDSLQKQENGLISYLKSFWPIREKQNTVETPVLADKILPKDFSASFRVLALEDFMKDTNESDNSDLSCDFDNAPFDLFVQPSNVFMTVESILFAIPTLACQLPDSFLAQISKLPSPTEKMETSKPKARPKVSDKSAPKNRSKITADEDMTDDSVCPDILTVRVVVFNSENFHRSSIGRCNFDRHKALPDGHVLVHKELRRMLLLEKTCRIQLNPLLKHRDTIPEQINLYYLFQKPAGFTDDMLELAARKWAESAVSSSYPLVLNDGSLVQYFIREGLCGECLVAFDSRLNGKDATERSYCLLSNKVIKSVKIKILPIAALTSGHTTRPSFPEVEDFQMRFPSVSFRQLYISDAVNITAMEYIDICLSQSPSVWNLFQQSPGLWNGGLLICGAKGSGKSVLGSAICLESTYQPYFAYVEVINCKALKGKKPETLRQYLQVKFDELSWRQPSVLFLDDLDQIAAPSNGPDHDMSGLAAYHTRIAEIVRDLMIRERSNGSALAVIATAISYSSIHPLLTSTRGNHLFARIIEIKPPNQEDRVKILQQLLKNRKEFSDECVENMDLMEVASQSEGYVVRDLEMIINRATHASLLEKTSSTGKIVLKDVHFKTALMDFTPTLLRSVALICPDELSWLDVGGLHEVRSILSQTLQWPSKYPKLFANCPLRIRSGLLLYGAPGTGKTHLAAVVAKEFKLNFISIKGPELFNKYIGASEQAVRDTFIKAQSAKPCILFFDEFDSLAPRRGHDNTGVTDRVVNQLLTQLDGVESLEGVFVLAATSRPDLIDPALLRPGRLDKAVHCPIPSKAERLEILQALSRKMQFSDNVDLQVISDKCEHFTGADFKALLYNAQLEAIHQRTSDLIHSKPSSLEHLGSVSNLTEAHHQPNKDTTPVILVTQENLLKASNDLRPSVAPSERFKYQQIYESFVGSRGGTFIADVNENVGQRVTLA